MYDATDSKIAEFKAYRIVTNDIDAIPDRLKLRVKVAFLRSSPAKIQTISDIKWVIDGGSSGMQKLSKQCVVRPDDLPPEMLMELDRFFARAKTGYSRFQRCHEEDIMTWIVEYVRTKFTFFIWDASLCFSADR